MEAPTTSQEPLVMSNYDHTILGFLQKLSPPWMIIHVGAGSGIGYLHQWHSWPISNAIIIDAEESRLTWAKPSMANRSWHVECALLDAINGESDYHIATNPDENGLISPDLLQSIWPNLCLVSQEKRPTRRLDSILEHTKYASNPHQGHIWTFIDCLPSLRILRGCGDELTHWSVLCLRVLLNTTNNSAPEASLAKITSFLSNRGFRCIHITEGIHPHIGHAFFIQDWPTQLTSLRNEHDIRLKLSVDNESHILTLKKEVQGLTAANTLLIQEKSCVIKNCDQQAQLISNLQKQVDASTKEMEKLTAERKILVKARDDQTKLAADRQAKIDVLQNNFNVIVSERDKWENEKVDYLLLRDQQPQLIADFQTRIDTLEQSHQTLAIERQNFLKSLEEQRALATERQAQIDALKKELTSLVADHEIRDKEKTDSLLIRDQQSQQVINLQSRIQNLENNKAALAKECQTTAKALKEQISINAEYQANIDRIQEELASNVEERQMLDKEKSDFILMHDQQVKQLEHQEARIEVLEQEKDKLSKECLAISKSRDIQLKIANERQALLTEANKQIKQLEVDQAESTLRQNQLHEELVKAEAQIDLIKDLLLHEPGI